MACCRERKVSEQHVSLIVFASPYEGMIEEMRRDEMCVDTYMTYSIVTSARGYLVAVNRSCPDHY